MGFFSKWKRNTSSTPDGTLIAAIGDIHGDKDKLDQLFEELDNLDVPSGIHKKEMIFLGDYVDRGTKSREILDLFCKGTYLEDWDKSYLMGNHEQLVLDFLNDGDNSLWLEWGGGLQTIASYCPELSLKEYGEYDEEGLKALLDAFRQSFPAEHIDFLNKLELHLIREDYYFAHAGVNPRKPLDEQSQMDLLWIRKPFLEYSKPFAKKIVHGHTPVKKPEILPNRIAVDTGCSRDGTLSAVVLWGTKIKTISV